MKKLCFRNNLCKTMILSALCLLMLTSVVACNKPVTPDTSTTSGISTTLSDTTADGLWSNALYNEDKEFGLGAKVIHLEVKAADKSVIFTIKTDKEKLSDALLEHDLITGEEGQYGLFVKSVNGITADYDADKAYWALSKDGVILNTGVDSTKINTDEHYEFVYTKG
ncbi:MAG TPA: DUF4430 domain-containing protein [Clostridia bacterium]|nr:DUF4430 domain-containing protein [Clostridia bacterium]